MTTISQQSHNGVVSSGIVRPVMDDDGYHCSPACPHLQKWDHPFWHHTAWCGRNLVDLTWHDYWLAACKHGDATTIMEKVRTAGRTKPNNKISDG